jgi:mannonate dehydratase
MQRRHVLKMGALAGGLGAITERERQAQAQVARATRGTPSPKIKDVQVIAMQIPASRPAAIARPGSVRLSVVKIITDQDGLYGYGCSTFTQRGELVNAAVEKYLKPFLMGKPTDRIDDLWQACYNSSYWRNGPVLNVAIGGVDQALWDIKGRQAGMPVYQLLGGKCREAADTYVHVTAPDLRRVLEDAKRAVKEQGFRNILLNPGYQTPGPSLRDGAVGTGDLGTNSIFDSELFARRSLQYMEAFRKELGDEVGLMVDIHERLAPNKAVQLAKDMEKLKLFFVEDLLSPEDIAYFRQIRQQCATPLAMGELFNSPHEWTPLIQDRLIDYMRMHVSQMGGLTPARKAAALGEILGVRTAWHGPPDTSPVGMAAQLHLDLACYNFGIQEFTFFSDQAKEIFRGCPEVKNGYMYANDLPGWGMEIDEKLAAKYPYGTDEQGDRQRLNGGWGELRRRDGTIVKQ